MSSTFSRRHFARLFTLGGSAALFSDPAWARQAPATALAWVGATGEVFWKSVREQFVMPPGLAGTNAANLSGAAASARDLGSRNRKRRSRPLAA